MSEQWQQSSAQPIPSSPGDQPLKGVGRVMTPQDNSSRDHRGFQDRQRSLPGQFDTPPGDAPPFGQASPPPPHMPNQQDPVMMMVPGERRYQTHEPAMEDTAPTPPPSHARGAAHLHTQQQQQMFDQVARVCCWSACCRTCCVYCLLPWATMLPVQSLLNGNKFIFHRDKDLFREWGVRG